MVNVGISGLLVLILEKDLLNRWFPVELEQPPQPHQDRVSIGCQLIRGYPYVIYKLKIILTRGGTAPAS